MARGLEISNKMISGRNDKKLELGLLVWAMDEVETRLDKVAQHGLDCCQLLCSVETFQQRIPVDRVRKAVAISGVRISHMFIMYEGQAHNNKDGPHTMGLATQFLREKRIDLTKRFADNARELGVLDLPIHIGFFPDDECHPEYGSFIEAMQDLCLYLKTQEQNLLLETGPELPSSLKRAINNIGTGNVYINLDTANPILYGCGDPLDAIEILGSFIRGVHIKDGFWPNRDEGLGPYALIGQGVVNMPLVLRRLKETGYSNTIVIEPKLNSPTRDEDIRHAISYLKPLL